MNSLDTSTLGWSPGLLGAYITWNVNIVFDAVSFCVLYYQSLTFLIASLTEFLLWGLSSTVSPT